MSWRILTDAESRPVLTSAVRPPAAWRSRSLTSVFVICLVGVVLGLPLEAQEAGKAEGRFQSKDSWFNVGGAYAFPTDKVGMSDEPGILVAVSNAGFVPEYIDYYFDRKNAIERFFRDDQTAVVYFHFDAEGKYKGLEYYFGSGNGCGFCFDPTVGSTVQKKDSRLTGKLTYESEEDQRFFDLEIDVPIAFESYGTPLTADGGGPIAAYAAFHSALADVSEATVNQLMPLVSAEVAATLSEHGIDYVRYLERSHPDSYRFVRGWTRADRALLLLEGTSDLGPVTVEAHLLEEQGEWKFDQEVQQLSHE
jgi:hypothetical protein